jgi:hypothetical protein
MKRRVICQLAILSVLVGGRPAAAQVRSGLEVGSLTSSIPVTDVTGQYKGERICYVCDFDEAPNVLAFFRDTSEDTAKLIVQLNQLYLRNKTRNFLAVAMIVAGADSKKWLENLNRTEKIEIPLTFFTKGPKDPAARVYKLNPDSRNTFLVTVDRMVAANVSDIGPADFSQVTDAAEQMLARTATKR